MKTEQQIQTNIIQWLRKEGHYVVKVVNATRAGVPDIVCCLRGGRFMAIEVKKPGGVISDLQTAHIEQLHQIGGDAIVVDNLRRVKDHVSLIMQQPNMEDHL